MRRRASSNHGDSTEPVNRTTFVPFLLLVVIVSSTFLLHGCAAVSVDVCISTATEAGKIHNLSQCLAYSGQQINEDANDASATTSSQLRVLAFNTTSTKVATYTLHVWAQGVLLAFVRSLLTRDRLYVRLPTATITGTTLAIGNTSNPSATAWWVQDLGLAMSPNASSTSTTLGTTMDGYLSTMPDAQSAVYGSVSLIKAPEYQDMTRVVSAFDAGKTLVFVTFPPSSQKYSYYGAVYAIPPGSVAGTLLVQRGQLLGRNNNLRFRLNASVNANGSLITVLEDPVDLAAGDTPVPSLLTGGVTAAPVTESVMSWYIYLMIGVGVLGGICLCIFLARKAKFRKEDKKKTAKRRKKEQDRFDKIAGDLRHGIEVEEDKAEGDEDYY